MEGYEINPRFKSKIEELNKYILKKKSNVKNEELTLFIVDREILPYECKKCKNDGTWEGKPLHLILDRLNNIFNDNRYENLRFLCPNCFSQIKKNKTLFTKIVKEEQLLCLDCNKRIANKTKKVGNLKCQQSYCKKCLDKRALLSSFENNTPKTV
jgi:phage anti-repressor protein